MEAAQDPLGRLAADLDARARLCDLIETVADALPSPHELLCLRVAAILRRDLPLYHADMDLGLFPLLLEHHADAAWIGRMLRRFEAEHADIEAMSDEIADLLERIGLGEVREAERAAAGYAFRAFFDLLRRRIAWDEHVVLPLAQETLSAEDRRRLAKTLAGNRQGARPDAILRAIGRRGG